jgi:hypothetical protein
MTELQTQTEQEEGAELYKEIVNMPILSQTEQEEGAELYKKIVNMPTTVNVKPVFLSTNAGYSARMKQKSPTGKQLGFF